MVGVVIIILSPKSELDRAAAIFTDFGLWKINVINKSTIVEYTVHTCSQYVIVQNIKLDQPLQVIW